MSNCKDLVECTELIYHYSTIKCHVVSTEEDTFGLDADRIFLPKSQVEKLADDLFMVPEWLAIEKGLI